MSKMSRQSRRSPFHPAGVINKADARSRRRHVGFAPLKPAEFVEFKEEAERIGFLGVLAGPLVRSSYRAGRLWAQSMLSKRRPIPAHLSHLAKETEFAQAV